MRNLIVALLSVGAIAGCTPPAEPDEAEQVVPQFHMALNGETFDEVYQSASQELRTRRSRDEFVGYLQSIRRNLGNIEATDRTDAKVDGTKVTLTYESTYARGKATEQFVVRVIEGQPKLLDHRILSPTLK